MKRVIKKALVKAKSNPRVASGILNASLKNIITDDKLTPLSVLQLGQAMKNFDGDTMGSYTMPGAGTMIDKMSVIVPDMESATSKKILAVFQGRASLSTAIKSTPSAGASVTTTTLAALGAVSSTTAPKTSSTIAKTTTAVPKTTTTVRSGTTTTTVPSVEIKQDTRGIVPPDDPTCSY